MENIADSINNLILKTYGGLLAFWGLIGYVFIRGLQFLGGCLAEGAINKGISRIVPLVRLEFKQEFDDLRAKIVEMDSKLTSYKNKKHAAENENKMLKSAIMSGDSQLIIVIKNYLENEKK